MTASTLVVYYSRTGLTKRLAQKIISLLWADEEELLDTRKRSGVIWFLISGRDAAQRRTTVLKPITYDPSQYDKVILCTPVRDFTMATPIRSYLLDQAKNFPEKIIFFATQGSSGAESAFQEMATLCGKKPIGMLAFTSKEISKNTYEGELQKFLWSLDIRKG